MGLIGKIFAYTINPLAFLADKINDATGVTRKMEEADAKAKAEGYDYGTLVNNAVSKVWDDFTGQTAIQKEYEANKELAQYQAQMNEEFYNKYSSPQALMQQYHEAGLNPNLMYGGAGSGQGNVPSYSSPSAPRYQSKLEQLSKGMSLISGLLNLQNLMYNTAASREVAEQNSVKTLSLFEDVMKKRRENTLGNLTVGYNPLGVRALFKGSALGRRKGYSTASLEELPIFSYSQAARSAAFNDFLKKGMSNLAEYGSYFDLDAERGPVSDDYIPNYWWRNQILKFDSKQRQFTYDWDNDYKTILKSAGVASPIIQTLLRLFGAK